MSETIDKIYCCDNNNAALWAMMNNNWSNNPFMYLIWLAFFGNNGFGFNRNGSDAGLIAQLQDSVNTNHNNDLAMQAIRGNGEALHELAGNLNVGVNALHSAVDGVKSAIQAVGAQNGVGYEKVINSVILGNKDLVQQICNCCCENKQLVTSMGYEGQIRDMQNTSAIEGKINDLHHDMSTGFASTAYATQAQTNAIQNSLQTQTLTILDKMCSMENQELHSKINDLTAQLTAANSRAERAAELAPIYNQLNAIRSAQPATTTVQYPQLTAVPNYVAYGYNNFNNGFWG